MALPGRKFRISWAVIFILASLMVSLWVVDAPAYVTCEDTGVCEFLEVICLDDNANQDIFITNSNSVETAPSFVNLYLNPHREDGSACSPLKRDRHGLGNQRYISPFYANHLSAKTLLSTISSILRS